MIFWYKNSFLASLVAIGGSILALIGITAIKTATPVSVF